VDFEICGDAAASPDTNVPPPMITETEHVDSMLLVFAINIKMV